MRPVLSGAHKARREVATPRVSSMALKPTKPPKLDKVGSSGPMTMR